MSRIRTDNLTGQGLEGVDADKYGVSARKFNSDFEIAMAQFDKETQNKENAQLGLLNAELDEMDEKGLSDLTIGELMRDGTKQITDMVSGKLTDGNTFAQRRLFYLGLICISMALLIWSVDSILSD